MPARHPRHLAAVLVAGALLAATLLPRGAAADPLPWRDKSAPFGMSATVANRVRRDEIDAYVGLLREAGVQWAREEFFWHEIQQVPGGPLRWNGDERGMYDYDHSVAALSGAGIRILGLIDYNPAWFKGQNPPRDAWLRDWGDFVYQVVARYGRGGPIKHWEIWNEPNLTQFGYQAGLYEVADYARVLDVARAAAKAADPEAVIVLAGMASIYDYPSSPTTYDSFDYLEALGRLGAWNDFDVLAIHPYRADAPEGSPWRRDQASPFPQEMRRLDEMMRRYGAKPVWITEVGWASDRGRYGVTLDQQAQFLQRFYLLALGWPSVEKIFWYNFRSDTDPNAPYDVPRASDWEHEWHFGLLRRTFPLDANDPALRKPAFIAYRALANELAGLKLEGVLADGQRPDIPATYWYRFGGPRRVDVLWNTDRADQVVQIDCGCREALLRHWNGAAKYLLGSQNGQIAVKLDEQGAPIFVEYDPPPAPGGRFFPATGHTLRGAMLGYWQANGGLARFGYPLTEELAEPDPASGRPRVVQYFERARFEFAPERAGEDYGVQIGLIGADTLRRYGVDWQAAPKLDSAPPGCRLFPGTGHSLCPPFLEHWEALGGLRLVGYPIGEPFPFQRADGQVITAQYFERARMELAPSGAVELGLLGRELLTP
jgi:hypothetical protein